MIEIEPLKSTNRILETEPDRSDTLARLAQATKVSVPDDPIIDRLQVAIDAANDDRFDREGLYFALGKVLDEVGRYEDAFAAYRDGNALSKERSPVYDTHATEAAIGQLIDICNSEWVQQNATDSDASPIFICGMFRSGSTLLEQMMGAHPDIVSGGELNVLPWLLPRRLGPYPERLRRLEHGEFAKVGAEYLTMSRSFFPDAEHLTDKRPDNFLHIGVIKAMFPKARIVYTRRDRRDNCLSVYFQQLGGNLSYSTGLETTAHYYDQHERLMQHWQQCLGNDLFSVNYEELVQSPESVLRALLDYLGLAWDEQCLDFHRNRSGGAVKTASIWQVREGLYTSSSGRWKNYETAIPELRSL